MAAMITLVGASMRGANVALPQNLSSLPLPPYVRMMDRRVRRRAAQKAARRICAEDNRRRNVSKRKALRQGRDHECIEVDAVICSMMNWQLNQFHRAGHTRRGCTLVVATKYATMLYWKAVNRAEAARRGSAQ